MFSDKTLLITGGTGSFGAAVLERMLRVGVRQIRVFSRDEKKQHDLRIALKNESVKFLLGDVRDYVSVSAAMRGVDFVFHAAALKQVPSCEFYPLEAVKTNIIGADNVMRAAIEEGVSRIVLLSTDKAVYPVNAMGISKAMMERVMLANSRLCGAGKTVLCTTRYGNVMASRGSVIPLFLSQIRSGEPLTVTDPKMTRFLMTLEESVDLVLFALANAKQGDTFVQKAPAATVGDVANALKMLLRAENPVKVIGTRHGEKRYESLLSREEIARAERIGSYFRIPADTRDLNYDKYFIDGEEEISDVEDYTSHNAERLDMAALKRQLLKLQIVQYAIKERASTRSSVGHAKPGGGGLGEYVAASL